MRVLQDRYPDSDRFWRTVVQTGLQVEHSLLGLLAGDNLLARRAYTRQLEDLRWDLMGPSPSQLEELLVQRVSDCGLHLQYVEATYAQNLRGLTLARAESQQRRIDRAHNRYLSAIRTLATVRRLQVPAVQVNIAQEQVNMVE